MTSRPTDTIAGFIPDAFAIAGGFHLQVEALDAGDEEFADQVTGMLADILAEAEKRSVIDLGAAFSLIILDLVNRLARISGEPRDDLWQTVIRELTERTMRREGGEER